MSEDERQVQQKQSNIPMLGQLEIVDSGEDTDIKR